MRTINPTTEQPIGDFPPDSPGEIEKKLASASAAFDDWRAQSPQQRAACLRRLAALFRQRKSSLAMLMAEEIGKPLTAGEGELTKCATTCDHFADNAPKLLEPTSLATGGGRGYSRFDPLGPILAIMPWNFPFWQLIRFGAAAVAAGNTIVLKHAPNVPKCALAIAGAFAEAGFPPGVLVNLRIDDNAAAQKLCGDGRIAAVTLTGSERAGSAVAAACGALLKKSVMELGGSDPFIVLRDADVEFAAASAAEGRCLNSGQSCIAAKRFIVDAAVLDRFLQAFRAAMTKQKLGPPMNHDTTMGPLARLDLLENLQRQVDQSLAAGATAILGGRRIMPVGYFFPPTILTGVRPDMAVFQEETFGPVAAVVPAANVNEAVSLANRTRFGLGASIWTRDLSAAERLAADLDAGNVFINSIVRSDPRLPFGGIKSSGWGRELAEAGLKEFTNIKTVWITKA
jgi:succinate-semialdehyde dehydrogenase/glutarate-semialdehyde dehydrogenase